MNPQDQISTLREQVVERVDDPTVKDELLRVLDKQASEQRQFAERIETETRSVDEALKSERFSTADAVAFAELKMRVEALDKTLESKVDQLEKAIIKLEDKAVSKWDVAITVFVILAALGGLVGAALTIVRWAVG